ncbi:MAG: hypothetical protein IJ506_06960 [Clostridia bacterium]|nr:hypothetical protein [Clostridia bacterium]
MNFEFMSDLDEYFCEKYAHYDKLCTLPGYRMPKMQDSKTDEFGRTYAYTLPAENMRLALQEKKTELLAKLKEQMTDKNFSFSFRPLGFFARIGDNFSKNSFRKWKTVVFGKYGLTNETAIEGIEISPKIWKKICGGAYYPTKNLIFSIALLNGFSVADTSDLLSVCGYRFDYTEVRDVVISYLLNKKITNAALREAAFEEYAVSNLFIKG